MNRIKFLSPTIVVITLGCSWIVSAQELPLAIKDITWSIGPNLPEFRKGGCLTTLAGKVVSVFGMRQPWGEMATCYLYDPAADDWTRGPDGPIGQVYVEGTECGGAFYAVGGRRGGPKATHGECFKLVADQNGKHTWSKLPSLNQPRGWAPSAAVGTRIYVFGGATVTDGTTLGSVETLDTAKPDDQWRKLTDIPGETRGWVTAATVKDKIYLIGGMHVHAKPGQEKEFDRRQLKEVWQFDPTSGEWSERSPLPYRLSGLDCCVYKDRYIIVVGGFAALEDFTSEMVQLYKSDRFHKSYYCPFVLVYDTVTDKWHRMPSSLPMPTNDIRVVLIGDKLYALGGENMEPATSNTTPWLRIGAIVRAGESECVKQ